MSTSVIANTVGQENESENPTDQQKTGGIPDAADVDTIVGGAAVHRPWYPGVPSSYIVDSAAFPVVAARNESALLGAAAERTVGWQTCTS